MSPTPSGPDEFACVVLTNTKFVRGLDGMLYCEECFAELWPDATPEIVEVSWGDRLREWQAAGNTVYGSAP